MGSDGSRYISKQVKTETAAPGFRIKSGWAAAVLLTGPIGSPALRDNRMVDLSDPRVPETRQPYSITRASLVIGSQLDPASIANPHIRAHALEGRLFRSAVEQALNANGIRTFILLERDAYARATAQLKKSSVDMRQTIQDLGRSTEGSWRAEQKVAALGAWLALCHKPRWNKKEKEKDENL